MDRPLVLIGLPGSGKTHAGQVLANRLARDFIDTDRAVIAACGADISDIVAERGWEEFRRAESMALAEALMRKGTVIASGGGSVESAINRERMATRAQVVWLQAGTESLLRRLAADAQQRPLLAGDAAAHIEELRVRREPLYADLAAFAVGTDGLSVMQIVDRIIAFLQSGNRTGAPV